LGLDFVLTQQQRHAVSKLALERPIEYSESPQSNLWYQNESLMHKDTLSVSFYKKAFEIQKRQQTKVIRPEEAFEQPKTPDSHQTTDFDHVGIQTTTEKVSIIDTNDSFVNPREKL
jgi:hypothetical protein